MLYINTRDYCESYTAARTLTVNTAPDGGLFVPFRMPVFTQTEICQLGQLPASHTIAHILNLFFRVRLTGFDVELCMGESPINMREIERKVLIAQLWNEDTPQYRELEYRLYCKLCVDVKPRDTVTSWARMAIRIAVCFAVLSAQIASGANCPDVAVNSGDFSRPMAAYYCKKMGIPIGKIICVCNENSGLWDLFTHGEQNTGANIIHTSLPELDISCSAELERLFFDLGGLPMAAAFVEKSCQKRQYRIPEGFGPTIEDTFAVCVVGAQRVSSVISRIFTTNNYVLDPYTALCFGGLQDYRATTGKGRETVIFAEDSPVVCKGAVAAALGIAEYKVAELL